MNVRLTNRSAVDTVSPMGGAMTVDPLPHSEELERALLGRLFLSPAKTAGDLGKLRPQHFYGGKHKLIFQAISDLRREGRPHDLPSVLQRLADRGQLDATGGPAYVAGLLDAAGTNPKLEHYVEGILYKARDRALARQTDALYQFSLSSPGPDADARLKALVTRLNRVALFEPRQVAGAHQATWSHQRLLETEFPPLRWAVDGLVVDEGLTLLGGKKKVGKSWFCLQIAQAVASGWAILERSTHQGDVVYLCLEDGPRRLARRLLLQQAAKELPIEYRTRFTTLNQGGLEELRALAARLQPRLIIIDTLAAAKTCDVDEDSAGVMADLGNALRSMAQDFQLAVLVVAHHGKHTRGDPGDDIRGSSATSAAADLNLGLYKEQGSHILRAEGRDIGELELRVEFDAVNTWSWHLLGDAREMARTEAEGEVLKAVNELGGADAAKIAKHLGKTRPAVQMVLKRLRERGQLPWKRDENDCNRIVYSPRTDL